MKKVREHTNAKENVGKLLLDLGKLVFGAFVLGGVLQGGISYGILTVIGIVIAFIFFVIGISATTKKINKEKE